MAPAPRQRTHRRWRHRERHERPASAPLTFFYDRKGGLPMTVATTGPVAQQVSADQARGGLAKFFVIADLAEQAPGMFSAYIDAEWHRLAETADYTDFCMTTVGHHVTHAPINGQG